MVSESTTLSQVDIPLISRGKLNGIFNAQSPSLFNNSRTVPLLPTMPPPLSYGTEFPNNCHRGVAPVSSAKRTQSRPLSPVALFRFGP